MEVVELLKLGREMLKMLSENGIKVDDWKYIALYSDYEEMVTGGGKISYVVAVLAEKYAISEASVWRVLRRFNRTI